jgi:D-alanine-D-alanine ligase
VFLALKEAGLDAHKFDLRPDTLGEFIDAGFDRAFNVLHGRFGEDGIVQGLLDSLNMPYTGSRVLGSALAMDKVRTKQMWSANGLPTANYRLIKSESDLAGIEQELGLPIFFKPACEGSSIGIAKASSSDDISSAWRTAAECGDDVLAESFLVGPEITVGILNGQALPCIRLEPNADFYDYQAKYLSDDTQYHCPAGLDIELENEIKQIALNAFSVLGCSGWGRIDFMLDENGKPFLLEANTVPGMTDHSLVPMAAKAEGLSFTQLVLQILEGAS